MKYLFTILSSIVIFSLFGQTHVYNKDTLFVQENTIVFIEGGFTNETENFENNGEFSLTGNLENTTELKTVGDGILRLVGEQNQIVFLRDLFQTRNLEIDNNEGARFVGYDNLSVYGDLEFTNGLFFTKDSSLIEFKEDALYFDADDLSYINGPAVKEGRDEFIFPIGKEGRLRPLRISSTNFTNSFKAEYFKETATSLYADPTLNNVSDWEYWSFEKNFGSEEPQLSLTWDELSFVNREDEDLQIAYQGPLGWTMVNSSTELPEQLDNELTSIDPILDYGLYTFGSTSAFTLIQDGISEFTLTKAACDVVISWSTVERSRRVNRYILQRLDDNGDYVDLNSVAAQNNSLVDSYSFRDVNTDDGAIYQYRIITVYFEGDRGMSEEKVIQSTCSPISFSLYPNPVFHNDYLTLAVESDIDKLLEIKLVDALGRVHQTKVLNITKGSTRFIIDNLLDYGAAEYFIWTPEEEDIETIKFQVIR